MMIYLLRSRPVIVGLCKGPFVSCWARLSEGGEDIVIVASQLVFLVAAELLVFLAAARWL
jgi:hypothetical protein